jgi:hypothetical protein
METTSPEESERNLNWWLLLEESPFFYPAPQTRYQHCRLFNLFLMVQGFFFSPALPSTPDYVINP